MKLKCKKTSEWWSNFSNNCQLPLHFQVHVVPHISSLVSRSSHHIRCSNYMLSIFPKGKESENSDFIIQLLPVGSIFCLSYLIQICADLRCKVPRNVHSWCIIKSTPFSHESARFSVSSCTIQSRTILCIIHFCTLYLHSKSNEGDEGLNGRRHGAVI